MTEMPIYINLDPKSISYNYESMGELVADTADLTLYHNFNDVVIFGTIFPSLNPNEIPYKVIGLNNY